MSNQSMRISLQLFHSSTSSVRQWLEAHASYWMSLGQDRKWTRARNRAVYSDLRIQTSSFCWVPASMLMLKGFFNVDDESFLGLTFVGLDDVIVVTFSAGVSFCLIWTILWTSIKSASTEESKEYTVCFAFCWCSLDVKVTRDETHLLLLHSRSLLEQVEQRCSS